MTESIATIARDVQRGRRTAVQVIREAMERIERAQPRLNAFITITPEAALAAAAALDQRRARGASLGPLAGVPLAVKDLILTREAPTTSGSRIYGDGIPADRDALIVRRLRAAGCIVVGKANLHEVALGVTNVNEHFGAARNPWNTAHVSGGSSGGSAVAVAGGLVPAALGSDTRGSIRIPASACGITGFKPTWGLVPLDGVLPLAPTLDTVGPMTRSVDDAARLLAAMLPLARGAALLRKSAGPVRRLTVGISEYHVRDLDAAVGRAVDAAIRALRPLVREVREVRIPELEGVQDASTVIASTEAVAYHDQFLRDRPDSYGPLVKSRLVLGYDRTAVEYVRAMEKRSVVQRALSQAFQEVDVLIGATLPVAPPTIAYPQVEFRGVKANVVEAFTRFNAPQNVAGIPSLTVPAGMAGGFPVGLQLFAASGDDAVVLALGRAWQRHTDWHERRPPRTGK